MQGGSQRGAHDVDGVGDRPLNLRQARHRRERRRGSRRGVTRNAQCHSCKHCARAKHTVRHENVIQGAPLRRRRVVNHASGIPMPRCVPLETMPPSRLRPEPAPGQHRPATRANTASAARIQNGTARRVLSTIARDHSPALGRTRNMPPGLTAVSWREPGARSLADRRGRLFAVWR